MQKKIKKRHRLFFTKRKKELCYMCDDKKLAIVLKVVRERIDEYKEKLSLSKKGITWKDVDKITNRLIHKEMPKWMDEEMRLRQIKLYFL
jgi:hypothetical protein